MSNRRFVGDGSLGRGSKGPTPISAWMDRTLAMMQSDGIDVTGGRWVMPPASYEALRAEGSVGAHRGVPIELAPGMIGIGYRLPSRLRLAA